MQNSEFQMLLDFFKAVGDENRLKIIGLVSSSPYRVSELAEKLELSEPTVSHHLSKLREVGLVNLKAEGNSRYYSLHTGTLARMHAYMDKLQTLDTKDIVGEADDEAWLDELDFEEWEIKILKNYTRHQKITQIPVKLKKLQVILRWIATSFEADKLYTEAEVNEIIKRFHPDYATLRRDLVEFKYMQRERGGAHYWLINKTARD